MKEHTDFLKNTPQSKIRDALAKIMIEKACNYHTNKELLIYFINFDVGGDRTNLTPYFSSQEIDKLEMSLITYLKTLQSKGFGWDFFLNSYVDWLNNLSYQ